MQGFRILAVLSIVLISGILADAASADTVILTNGRSLQCDVITLDREKLTIQVSKGTMQFPRADVQSITFGDQSAEELPASETKPSVPAPDGTKAYQALVRRVIDGDTIELTDGRKVRYIGLNTPETKHPTKGVEWYGKEAAAFNKKLVEGKRVSLEFDVQKKDRYGRLLAYVFVPLSTVRKLPEFKDLKEKETPRIFVNAELVRLGYAQVMTIPPNVKHQKLFLKLQREARAAKHGFWGKSPEEAKEPKVSEDERGYVASRKSEVFHVVPCSHANRIKPSNRIYFETRKEAIESGRRPCKRCKP